MSANVWSGPIGKLVALEDAVKALCGQGTVSKKLGAATDQLLHYQATEFPEPLRARFERLMDARVKASRPYSGGMLFDFGNNRAEHIALRQAVVDLYKACLLDLGASGDREFFQIAYPHAPEGTTTPAPGSPSPQPEREQVEIFADLVDGGLMDWDGQFAADKLVTYKSLVAAGFEGWKLIHELLTDDWAAPPVMVRIVVNGKEVARIPYDKPKRRRY